MATAKSPADIPSQIGQVLAKRCDRFIEINTGAIAKAIKKLSLSEASAKLPELFASLDYKIFGNNLAQSMILASLVGRDAVLQDLSDPTRLDAATPAWLKMPWLEAIAYFRQKTNIPIDDYSQEAEGYHNWAFSVAHLTNADLLAAVRFLLDNAIAEGISGDAFIKQFNRRVGRAGWQPGTPRINTIFDTNVRQAYRGGRYAATNDEELQAIAPYLVWKHRDSRVPRPLHLALNDKCILASDPFWSVAYPQCAWGCHCLAIAISAEVVNARGYQILSGADVPDPMAIADPGFRYAPVLIGGGMSSQMVNDRLKSIPPDIADQARRSL